MAETVGRPDPPPKRPSGVFEVRDTGIPRVLVADDSALSRRILEEKLRKWGFDVVVAVDGTEAWGILQQVGAPPLAILDWEMPGLTGLQICRKVREQAREPYLYMIILTANDRKEAVIEGLAAGADDYITKPFDEHELEVRLRAGQRVCDLQAQLIAAREVLRAQATHDPLTGLFNRRAIFEILEQELSRGRRDESNVAVLLVDLDHFKDINDRFGHAAGDTVLCETASRMRSVLRPYDAIGRYGGEEFLVVMPGCDTPALLRRGEELREVIGRSPVSVGGTPVPVTGSIGIAACHPIGALDPGPLVEKADTALYRAKFAGRNRVELA